MVAKNGSVVELDVADTYEKVSAPETEGFFLSAVHDPARLAKRAPLAEAISLDDICDEEFILAHVREYIASVEVVSASSRVSAVYRVEFTDPRWVAHLKAGQSWGTASYDLGDEVLRDQLGALADGPSFAPKRGAAKAKKPSEKEIVTRVGPSRTRRRSS